VESFFAGVLFVIKTPTSSNKMILPPYLVGVKKGSGIPHKSFSTVLHPSAYYDQSWTIGNSSFFLYDGSYLFKNYSRNHSGSLAGTGRVMTASVMELWLD
jgi:hypothetical protein